MRVGVTLFAQNYTDWDRYEAGDWDSDPEISDAQVYDEEIKIGNQVEPLGFDSLWTVEHHFTPYTMDTNPLQFLTYFAGTTTRIDLGTMVVVLPWHDPVRVAEQAAMLDHFLQGRRLHLGFGRGAAKVEFDGLRIDMNSSRERFLDALAVVRKGLTQRHFSHDGPHFQIPEINLRPRPRHTDFDEYMYMSWGSPASVSVAAENGLKPLVIPQKEWDIHVKEMETYNEIRANLGMPPGQPVVLLAVYVHEDPDVAEEIGHHHVREYADSARRHYQFDKPEHLIGVKGYEYYDDLAAKFVAENEAIVQARMERMEARKQGLASAMMDQFTESHVWGTPDSVFEQIRERMHGVGGQEFVGVFKFGSMSYETANDSLNLFAEKVLPRLHAMETPQPRVASTV